jgi:glutamyl-tRNA synthetase
LEAHGHEISPEALLAVMPAMRVRMKKLADAEPFLQFLWDEDQLTTLEATPVSPCQTAGRDAALRGLQQARDFLATVQPFDHETVSAGLTAIGEGVTLNGKAGPFLGVMRLAVTGQDVSPPLFESILALGRDRTLKRLQQAISVLQEPHS